MIRARCRIHDLRQPRAGEGMRSAILSKPAGQQLAEAVLAAALTVPLVFAFVELMNSGLVRGTASPQAAESSPILDSTPQPVLTLHLTTPTLEPRRGNPQAADESAAKVGHRAIPNIQDSSRVAGPEFRNHDGDPEAAVSNRAHVPALRDTEAAQAALSPGAKARRRTN